MKNKYYKFFILIFFIFTFFIFYYGLKQKNFYTPEDTSIKRFPNLLLNDFYTNNQISFDDILIDNNYYLINIWASWCIPCRQEHKHIKNLSEIDNLKLVGLNYKDKTKNAENFLKEFGNPFDIILSDKDGTKSIFLGAYGVPETLILDSELKILKKYIGPINSKIVDEIKNLTN